MPSRDDLTVALVAGATAAAVACCLNFSARGLATPGEILTFFGGACGAGFAVLGGIWLEERKSSKRLIVLADAIKIMGVMATRLASSSKVNVVAHLDTLLMAISNFQTVQALARVDDARILFSLGAIHRNLDGIIGKIGILTKRAEDSSQLEAVLADSITLGTAVAGAANSVFSYGGWPIGRKQIRQVATRKNK